MPTFSQGISFVKKSFTNLRAAEKLDRTFKFAWNH